MSLFEKSFCLIKYIPRKFQIESLHGYFQVKWKDCRVDFARGVFETIFCSLLFQLSNLTVGGEKLNGKILNLALGGKKSIFRVSGKPIHYQWA